MEDAGTPTPRRRWAQILFSVLVVLALGLIVSALGVGAGGPPWADEPEQVDGYPQRIEKPYVVRDLPAKPGAVAGLIRDGRTWLVVSPQGQVWKLADNFDEMQVQPALSDDGRVLAYLQETSDDAGEYVLRDLVSGRLTVIPDVTGGGDSDAPFFISGQQPTYLSPDGQQVLARGGRPGGRDNDGLLISKEGVRELFVKGVGWPAGFAPGGRLAWLVTPRFPDTSRTPELLATTDSGAELGRLKVKLSRPMAFDQWSARLSPEGDFLAVTALDDGQSVVAQVSVEDGREISRHTAPALTICQPTWRGDEVLTSGTDHVLVDADVDDVVVADPAFEVECSIWAERAIAGDEHHGFSGTVFGTSTAWWSWRWRQLGAGLLLIVAALGLGWARGRLPGGRSS